MRSDMPNPKLTPPEKAAVLTALLRGLTGRDDLWVEWRPEKPDPYRSQGYPAIPGHYVALAPPGKGSRQNLHLRGFGAERSSMLYLKTMLTRWVAANPHLWQPEPAEEAS
jgi:hypothetical protein